MMACSGIHINYQPHHEVRHVVQSCITALAKAECMRGTNANVETILVCSLASSHEACHRHQVQGRVFKGLRRVKSSTSSPVMHLLACCAYFESCSHNAIHLTGELESI